MDFDPLALKARRFSVERSKFHAAGGGFGDFLDEADVGEAGFDIEIAALTRFRYSMRP
jgi:hypothetical protein